MSKIQGARGGAWPLPIWVFISKSSLVSVLQEMLRSDTYYVRNFERVFGEHGWIMLGCFSRTKPAFRVSKKNYTGNQVYQEYRGTFTPSQDFVLLSGGMLMMKMKHITCLLEISKNSGICIHICRGKASGSLFFGGHG